MNKILLISVIFLLTSCVSSQKFNELTSSFESLREQNQSLKVQNTELQSRIEKQIKDIADLSAKLDENSLILKNSSETNQRLSRINSELENQLNSLKTGSSEEIARLMEKLQQTQTDLQKREDILKSAQKELEQRSIRLKELEDALRQKDDAVKQLRQKVMDALLGFNNKGLTIHEK
ncbi:MAG: hypothetical protein Q7J86_10345, partial [Bacteroidota bacterium]|nr:hypothetical protein [Bacteroidota bacterium]